MKRVAHARSSSARPGSGRKAAARVQTKLRPGAGNHRRQRGDSLERQADEIAARIVRGEKCPSHRIAPTVAAGFSLGGSAGRPLPHRLRGEMESLFGADFQAVRIHTGPAADSAARELGANAFASGRDIYFRSGLYAPQTLLGKELLAHELTHVLQQTGRLSHQGILRATGVSNMGPVQCDDPPLSSAPPETPPPGYNAQGAFQLTVRLHSTAHRGDAQLAQVVQQFTTDLGGQLTIQPPPRPGAEIAAAVLSGTYDRHSAPARSFIVDCLKVLGHYPAAARLIDRDTRLELETVGRFPNFLQYLREPPYTAAWAADALRHSSLRNFWPNGLAAAYRNFLYAPHSLPQPDTRFDTAERALRERMTQSQGLGPSDRVLLAWDLYRAMENERIQKCSDLQTEVLQGYPLFTWVERRIEVARRLQRWAEERFNDTTEPNYRREFMSRLTTLAGTAVADWQAGQREIDAFVGHFEDVASDALFDAHQRHLRRSLPRSPAITAFRQLLVTQGRELLGLVEEEGEFFPPSAAEYEQRRDRFRAALASSTLDDRNRQTLGGAVAALDTALTDAVRLNRRETVTALIVLSLWSNRFYLGLNGYNRAADDATPDLADERVGHRIQIGRALARLGVWLGWDDLTAVGRSAVQAELEGGTVLALMSPWHPETIASLSELSSDFRGSLDRPVLVERDAQNLIVRESPLTLRHLTTWFDIVYAMGLDATVRELLRGEEQPMASTQLDFSGAIEALNATARPKRFRVDDFEYATPPGEVPNAQVLIETHPRTISELLPQRPTPLGVILFPAQSTHAVFAWVLPDLTPLIRMLMQVPSLRQLNPAEQDPKEWIFNLPTAALAAPAEANMSPEQIRAALMQQILDRLQERSRAIRTPLPMLFRRLSIYRRRILIARIQRDLTDYLLDPRVTGSNTNPEIRTPHSAIPNALISEIEDFSGTVVPTEDQLPQVAALIIGVAPLLQQLFAVNHEFALTERIYPYLLTGIHYSDGDADRRREVRAVVDTMEDMALTSSSAERMATAHGQLEAAKQSIDDARRATQRLFGFTSEDGRSIRPLLYATPIPINQEWIVGGEWDPEARAFREGTGTRYKIVQIFRRFTYMQGDATPHGTGPVTPPRLLDESGTDVAATGDALLLLHVNGEERVVLDNDVPYLNLLVELFEGRSLQIQMEHLAYYIQESTTIMLDVVELVPGVGQAVSAARLSVTFIQFLATDQFRDIISQLRDDPGEVLDTVIERIEGTYLTPENLWRYVLLSGDSPWNAFRTLFPARAPRGTVAPQTRLGRLIAFLRRLGTKLYDALAGLRRHFRGPFRAAQGSIAARPRLSWLLQRALHGFEALVDLIPSERTSMFAGLAETGRNLSESLSTMLEGLQHLELPREVVPLDMAVNFIIDFILDRFGARGRIARRVLDAARITPTVSAAIADEMRDSPVDPNRLWREDLIPLIEGKFIEVRNELVTGIYTRVDPIVRGVGLQPLRQPSPDDLPHPSVATAPLDETELSPDPGRVRRTRLRVAMPSDAGQPLSESVRGNLEQRFQQDFNHVRLHTGAAADAAAAQLGARGLTSGSHIVLSPDLDPAQPTGRRVLAHELVHVIQQTGSRPLGQRHSTAPVRGRRSRGLRIDPDRERSAERIASVVSTSERPIARSQFSPADAGADGVQPILGETTLDSILEALTEIRGASDFADTTLAGGGANVPGIADARRLWHEAVAVIRAATASGFSGFLESVQTQVKDELLHDQATLDAAIPGIAHLAQRPIPNRAADQEPRTELNPRRFITLLEGYLFARRGIGVQLRQLVTAPYTVEGVSIHYVHLPWIRHDSPLWALVMQNTPGLGSATDRTEAKNEIRERLRILGPAPFIWPRLGTAFRFSTDFTEDYIAEQGRRSRRTATTVPAAQEYKTTTGSTGNGLRIGLHGGQQGPNRQSHHTTQYLLVQYFRNHNALKAFPRSNQRNYPSSIQFGSGSNIDAIAPGSGGNPLGLAELDPGSGRGTAMPAILLAADTHIRGELHVLKEYTWNDANEETGTPTQGIAINNQFHNFVRSRNAALVPDTDATHDAALNAAVAASPSVAGQVYYDAAVDTYHWMYRRMIPNLRTALISRELAYYRGIAARTQTANTATGQLNPQYDLTAADMATVWTAAKRNNDDVMSAAHWRAPSGI